MTMKSRHVDLIPQSADSLFNFDFTNIHSSETTQRPRRTQKLPNRQAISIRQHNTPEKTKIETHTMKLNNTLTTKRKAGMTLLELTVVILVLLSLISILFVGARAWKKGSDRAGQHPEHPQHASKPMRGEQNMKSLERPAMHSLQPTLRNTSSARSRSTVTPPMVACTTLPVPRSRLTLPIRPRLCPHLAGAVCRWSARRDLRSQRPAETTGW